MRASSLCIVLSIKEYQIALNFFEMKISLEWQDWDQAQQSMRRGKEQACFYKMCVNLLQKPCKFNVMVERSQQRGRNLEPFLNPVGLLGLHNKSVSKKRTSGGGRHTPPWAASGAGSTAILASRVIAWVAVPRWCQLILIHSE